MYSVAEPGVFKGFRTSQSAILIVYGMHILWKRFDSERLADARRDVYQLLIVGGGW